MRLALRVLLGSLPALGLALVHGAASPARAESWCAYPLVVHEWGVHVHGADGRPTEGVELPGWFHTPRTVGRPGSPTPVRALPADSGIRLLPMLHFYGLPGFGASIPVGLEVGFTRGPAAAWFPAVDRWNDAALANAPAAKFARARLIAERSALTPHGPRTTPPPPDPTRQLVWDRLELSPAPPEGAAPPHPSELAWVKQARALDGALWVSAAREFERFVFYEAATSEAVPLALVRGPTFGPGRRHYLLENRGKHPVHDVFVVHREAGATYVFLAPMIPAGRHAGFLLEDHRVTDLEAATVTRLATLLTDPTSPVPSPERGWSGSVGGGCVMGRDPAIPVERASGHRLYRAEVELLLGVWKRRFFEQPGTTILYREDPAALDEAMPLSIYTDMYHFVELRRAGLALWEQVRLP